MEANTEVYHVKSIHPATVDVLLDDRQERQHLLSRRPRPHGRAVTRADRRCQAVSRAVRRKWTSQTVGEIARTCTQSYGMFPNWVSPLGSYGFPVAAVLAQRHEQVPTGGLVVRRRLGRGREVQTTGTVLYRSLQRRADRGHRIRQMDPEVASSPTASRACR